MSDITRRQLAFGAVIIALGLRVLALQLPESNRSTVYTAEVDSVIHPVSAEFMRDAIARADAAHATLIVFTLRTPGGLVDSTEVIVSQILAAKTPVAVFVGPAGGRAASAGFIVTLASDLAVMAPSTHIGAASPVAGNGEKMDDTMARKATADLAARARTLAATRHRNIDLANEAVTAARAYTETEALNASPPLIDFIATDVADLLRKADGRTVVRPDGSKATLHTADAMVVDIEMNWRQRILSAIAHPNVAYLLLTLGTLGLTIELWSPGAVLPGVAGGLCLLLAFFAFQVLPINYAGLLLILFGIVLLILEVKVASFGLLTSGGLASLFFGALILMDSSASDLKVSLRVIIPVTLGVAAILIFLVQLAVRAQRQRPVTGMAGMVDQVGRALTPIGPDQAGRVSVRGELWQAVSLAPIEAGDDVRILGIDGLTLTVTRATPVAEARRSA
jgi:membrane-bound serine protease (ClpP class)